MFIPIHSVRAFAKPERLDEAYLFSLLFLYHYPRSPCLGRM
jgi:hypothetical protein